MRTSERETRMTLLPFNGSGDHIAALHVEEGEGRGEGRGGKGRGRLEGAVRLDAVRLPKLIPG